MTAICRVVYATRFGCDGRCEGNPTSDDISSPYRNRLFMNEDLVSSLMHGPWGMEDEFLQSFSVRFFILLQSSFTKTDLLCLNNHISRSRTDEISCLKYNEKDLISLHFYIFIIWLGSNRYHSINRIAKGYV